jgi:tetratricopeptide (TPR) repeat protein
VVIFLAFFFLVQTGSALNKTADQWNDEGVNLYQNMSYNESLAAFGNAITLKPDHEYAWYNIGLALEAIGDYDNALKALGKSIEINPLSSDAWYEKGRILEMLGNVSESEAAYSTYDRLSEFEQDGEQDSAPGIPVQGIKPELTANPAGDSEPAVMDKEFDRLYKENDPKISENLHQITALLKNRNWGQTDKESVKMANFITEYMAEMKSLKLSPQYDSARDVYVFFLKQLAGVNRQLSDLASLYPMYFNNVIDYSKADNDDFLYRLDTVITSIGTAQSELKRFNEIYSKI